jgi:hypothetical protein
MFCCEFIGRDPTFFPGIHMILEYNIHKPKAPHGGWGLSMRDYVNLACMEYTKGT